MPSVNLVGGAAELKEFEAWREGLEVASGVGQPYQQYLSRLAEARAGAERQFTTETHSLSKTAYIEWLKKQTEEIILAERHRSQSVDRFRFTKSIETMASPGFPSIWYYSTKALCAFASLASVLSQRWSVTISGLMGTIAFAVVSDLILKRLNNRFESRWKREIKKVALQELSDLVARINKSSMEPLGDFLRELPAQLEKKEGKDADNYSKEAERILALLSVIQAMKNSLNEDLNGAYDAAGFQMRGKFPVSKSRQLKAWKDELDDIQREVFALFNLAAVSVLQEGYAKATNNEGRLLATMQINPFDLEALFQVSSPRGDDISCASLLSRLSLKTPSAL